MCIIQEKRFQYPVKVHFLLQHIELSPTLAAYRLTRVERVSQTDDAQYNYDWHPSKSVVKEGFTSIEAIEAFEQTGELPSPTTFGSPVLINNKDLAQFQTPGFQAFIESPLYCGVLNSVKQPLPFTQLIDKEEGHSLILIYVDISRGLIRDFQGNLLPTAISFNSGIGGITSNYFDLAKVQAILAWNPNIQPLVYNMPISILRRFKHYNSVEYLNFLFKPTSQDMAKIQSLLDSDSPLKPTTLQEAILQLDLLGIRTAALNVALPDPID